ncbi:MAG: ATP-binding protein, partial [Bacteroidota bacterium]
MHSLADFLNHGTLPFVGRDIEVQRILDFWRGTFQATELRAMLLTGEAGIGKSRILEHVMGQTVAAGGSVVHVKLYPESATSFMSLVARALWHQDAGRFCLTEEPEAKLTAVSGAMQRLARLRPTLFVLEDLHLLGGEALPDLMRLLRTLADETVSVLCLTRPVELEARGALEPYLVDEFVLRGILPEDCARVWEDVAGLSLGTDVAAALYDATAGNPLALRSSLRGALRS